MISAITIKNVKLDSIATIQNGKTPKSINKYISTEGGIPFYKVADMNKGEDGISLSNSAISITERGVEELSLSTAPVGTIVFPKRGGAILTNKKRLLKKEGAFDTNIMGVIPDSESVYAKYLYYWFLSFNLSDLISGSTVPQINNGDINPLLIPIPHKDEDISLKAQKRIADKIEKLFSEIDKAIEKTRDSLNKAEVLYETKLNEVFSKKHNRNWLKVKNDDVCKVL